MSDTARRVREAARDASSNDDLVRDDFEIWEEGADPFHPLDEETFDERASTQMGEMYESRRHDAN